MELTHQDATEVNTFQKNRAGLLSENPDGTFVGRTIQAPDEDRPSATMKAVVRGKELNLREAYTRYKDNKGIGRADMIGLLVEAVEALQDRIGSVDEAAVAALALRVTSLETVIGNALAARGEPAAPKAPPPGSMRAEEEERIASIFRADQSLRLPDGWTWDGPQLSDYARFVCIGARSPDGLMTYWSAPYRSMKHVDSVGDAAAAQVDMGEAIRELASKVAALQAAPAPKRGPGRPPKVKPEGDGNA